jgi:hypothetical protein
MGQMYFHNPEIATAALQPRNDEVGSLDSPVKPENGKEKKIGQRG